MNTEQYIQLIAWAYFWAFVIVYTMRLAVLIVALVQKAKINLSINWLLLLQLFLWLISIKLK